jgi:hypothetical protein
MLVKLIQQHDSCAIQRRLPVLQTPLRVLSYPIVIFLFGAPHNKGVPIQILVMSLQVIKSPWFLTPLMLTAKCSLQDPLPNAKPAKMDITGPLRIVNFPQSCLALHSCSLSACSFIKNLICRRLFKSEKYTKRSRN